MNRSQSIERCTGPNDDRRNWGIIPADKQPIVSQDENGINCQYLQENGSCVAMQSLLPEIVARRTLSLRLIREDFKSDKPTRKKSANVNLRDVTRDLSMAARMAQDLPVCRLLEEQRIPS